MLVKRRDYYNAVMVEIDAGIMAQKFCAEEISKLEKKIKSGRYSQDTINEFRADIRRNESHMQSEREMRLNNIKKLSKPMKASLADELKLHGADLTPDVELLKLGIDLEVDELVDLMMQNNRNPTMIKMIFRYAKGKGIDLPVFFHANNEELKAMEVILEVAEVVLRHYYNPKVYNDLLGEGNFFAAAFDVDDDKFHSSSSMVGYTDARVANAVRMLNDPNLPEDAQRGIMEEFADNPPVLKVLHRAAVGAGQDAAEKRAAALLGIEEKTDKKAGNGQSWPAVL